ncbi:MAG: restriction endonuclease subunit S [Pseudomonas sp.]
MSSEVKLGYKWTEAGVIPEDWCIKPLAELCTFENGDRGKNYPSPGSFVSSGIPFINAGHLSNGNIDLRQMDYISPERFNKLGGGKVRNGDILFCLRGSLGKFGVITSEITCGAIASSLVIIRQKSSSITQEYLISYFSSELCASMIEIWAGGAAQPNLGAQDLAKFLVAMPQSQDEQKKIASALADADALISSLDQLIAKKRDIQQATMQQLLTGQRRLPGFSGEWQVKILGEVCKITTGKKDVNEGNPSGQYPFFTCARDHTYSDHYSFDCEAILVAGNGEVGNLNYYFGKFEAYQRTYVLYEFYANTNYIWHALKFGLAASLGIGKIGSSIPYIKKSDLTNFELPLPAPEEQAAIAATISDMSAELSALETRREKARQLKQGMMQELLTGRIRLK